MTSPGRSTARRKPPHVLANPPFRRLWTAVSVCGLGDWLNLLALTALAGNLTAESGHVAQGLAIGGVFVVKLLPDVLLGPLAGTLADRFDRRLTMAAADLARFALVISIPLADAGYGWLITAAFLIECARLLWVPAKDATVPGLVPRERLEEADRLGLLVTYGTAPVAALLFAVLSVTGDALAGLAPYLAERDTYLALTVNALAYLASAVLVLTLRDIPRGRTGAVPVPSVLRQVAEGRRFAGGDRLVRALVAGMLCAFAAGGAVVGVAKIYVGALGGGDAAYGMVFGAVSAGTAAGMFFEPRLLRGLSRRRLFGLSIVVAGPVLAAVALVHDLAVVVMLTALLGVCAGLAWSIGHSMIGLEAEDRLRGRASAFLRSSARITLLLAVAVAPVLAGLYGEHRVVVGGERIYRFDGSNLVLLACGLLVAGAGLVSLRRVDDRGGVPVLTDLAAAVRGRRPGSEDAEEPRGMFIAFEGGEGSGKTTQSRLLAIWLRDQGFDVVQTREPGSTKVGMRLRAILLDAVHQGLSPRAEALMYAADRAEHVEKVIRPALRRGAMVVSDRYVDSSLAYQGAGRALDRAEVAEVNAWATGGLAPDLTVLIDTPPAIGLTRLGGAADRIESEPQEFHERVRREFRALAAADPGRYFVVDGTLAQGEISRLIQDRVREVLPDPVPREAEDVTGTMPAIRD
ncbi:dTMP kinase [Planomonospora corallina]|uniref:Thymidylate kinase n=1 Tax=Planomonospora corallina TaxID=1806052 RepID=A0ABV8I217_9ACTN